jgi:hypothetical protein
VVSKTPSPEGLSSSPLVGVVGAGWDDEHVPTTFAISDIHGHLDDLLVALKRAELVDDAGSWIGGGNRLLVLGDLLDRGPDGIGVVRLLRQLQEQAPEQVQVLLGNHEILTLAVWLFGEDDFALAWRRNGGVPADQSALSTDDIAWLRSLPAMALVGDDLLMHSDSTAYAEWGRSVAEVNQRVHRLLHLDDSDGHREVWRALAQRRRFVGPGGAERAQALLTQFGGSRIVHGHSIVATLRGTTPGHGALSYADGLALAIDGGRYDGGPLLLVDLAQTD